jgi:hypothetical protein
VSAASRTSRRNPTLSSALALSQGVLPTTGGRVPHPCAFFAQGWDSTAVGRRSFPTRKQNNPLDSNRPSYEKRLHSLRLGRSPSQSMSDMVIYRQLRSRDPRLTMAKLCSGRNSTGSCEVRSGGPARKRKSARQTT